MEITSEVFNILKCCKCSELLSCGPVYLFPTTQDVICGRCDYEPENDNDNDNVDSTTQSSELLKVRYIHYEAAASLLLFPCRFKKYGCKQNLQFSADGPDSHENSCTFKPYHCPMNPNFNCPWQNTRDKFLEHCKNAHPQQVFDNPCYYPPKWNTSSERTFLITYMDHLFLLYVKVCLQSGKILHSVRLFGDPALASGFYFVFKAKRNKIEYTQKDSVLPAGSLLMEETSAISTQIYNLIEILGNNLERSVFTVTISVAMENCKFCKAEIEFSKAKICSNCLLKMRKCKYSTDCTYEDVNKYKCYKHEYYYCEYRTNCSFSFCFKTFSPGHFFQHFKNSTCRSVTSEQIGVFWHADHSKEFCVLDSCIGPILCNYFMKFSTLYLYIYTSLASNELDFYQFVIQIKGANVVSSTMDTAIAELVDNDEYDWKLIFDLKNFSTWRNYGVWLNIKINNIANKT